MQLNIINTDFSRTWESIQTSGIENSDSSIFGVNIFGYNWVGWPKR